MYYSDILQDTLDEQYLGWLSTGKLSARRKLTESGLDEAPPGWLDMGAVLFGVLVFTDEEVIGGYLKYGEPPQVDGGGHGPGTRAAVATRVTHQPLRIYV